MIDLVECRARGEFSLAGATKYFCHERLIITTMTEAGKHAEVTRDK